MGNAVLRREDPDLLTGAARYVGDMDPPGTVHMAFVRSVMAHARIASVETEAARSAPGVLGVWTAADMPIAPQHLFIMLPPELARLPLADKARYVGDPIAVVVAESRAAAVDAAELVEVDYDPLPAVTDPFEALEPDAAVIIEAHGSNKAIEFVTTAESETMTGHDVVVKGQFVNHRMSGAPIEPSVVLAAPGNGDREDGVTLWCTTQRPHEVRDQVAAALEAPPDQVRVIAPAVGGGFGPKAVVYPEFVMAAWLARRLGRPVKWVETRSENLINMTHGRDHVHDVELGLTAGGTFRWLRVKATANVGAYPGIGGFIPFFTMSMASGPYRIPAVDYEAVAVITNTTPVAAFRGAGRPEATITLERIVDMAAAKIGMDPAELRRRNLLAPDDFPLTTPTGATMDCGEYVRAPRVGPGEGRICRTARGTGPPAGLGQPEAARHRRMHVCGDNRRRSVHRVRIGHGRTRRHHHSPSGHRVPRPGTRHRLLPGPGRGAGRARRPGQGDPQRHRRGPPRHRHGGVPVAADRRQRGVHIAANEVLETAKRLAAGLLEADSADIVVAPGGLAVAGVPARTVTWADLAAAADTDDLPAGVEPGGLAAETDFTQSESTYPFGAHVSVVEIDADTGDTRALRHIAVDDCGRILNPLLVQGQVHGGVATGISQALYEETTFDSDGNPRNTNFADYAIPAASELPRFETAHTETPTPLNPLGAKGVGESGTIGSTPAVQAAVLDALAPLGIDHLDMPFTPQRVWRAIAAAENSACNLIN